MCVKYSKGYICKEGMTSLVSSFHAYVVNEFYFVKMYYSDCIKICIMPQIHSNTWETSCRFIYVYIIFIPSVLII